MKQRNSPIPEAYITSNISQEKFLRNTFYALGAATLFSAASAVVPQIAEGDFNLAYSLAAAAGLAVGGMACSEARDSSQEIRYLSGQQRPDQV